MDITILANPEAVADAATDLVEARIRISTSISIGLAGGSTPRATYAALSNRDIDWSRVTTWMTDERWVLPTDEASNQRMVRESLAPEAILTFVAPDTEQEDPGIAATRYSERVVPLIREAGDSIALLGIGPDGHTASLFPGTEALDNTTTSYVANYVGSEKTWRLTATFGLLASNNAVVFLVTGSDKADVLSRIADGDNYPAARVTAKEKVIWLVDEAAAARL